MPPPMPPTPLGVLPLGMPPRTPLGMPPPMPSITSISASITRPIFGTFS
jgi:hypothetical protein